MYQICFASWLLVTGIAGFGMIAVAGRKGAQYWVAFHHTNRLKMSRREYARKVMPIGFFYAASLWLSNSAYLHLSVSFIQMTKALMPGLVYIVGVFFRMEKLTARTSLNMVVIAIGVAIAAYGELNFDTLGVTQQLSALLFEAVRLMLVQILITRQGMAMNPLQSLYYVSPACAFFSIHLHYF